MRNTILCQKTKTVTGHFMTFIKTFPTSNYMQSWASVLSCIIISVLVWHLTTVAMNIFAATVPVSGVQKIVMVYQTFHDVQNIFLIWSYKCLKSKSERDCKEISRHCDSLESTSFFNCYNKSNWPWKYQSTPIGYRFQTDIFVVLLWHRDNIMASSKLPFMHKRTHKPCGQEVDIVWIYSGDEGSLLPDMSPSH